MNIPNTSLTRLRVNQGLKFLKFLPLFLLYFSLTPLHAQNWQEVLDAAASDGAGADYFGHSVSISGDYAIVGANTEGGDAAGANHLTNAGSAYIFERSGGTWSEVQKIVASDRESGDLFGQSVSISGDYAIVGALLEDEDAAGGNTLVNAGSAYIFERSGGTWTEVQKIVASDRDANDYFGHSVSISEDYVIIGTYNEDHAVAGGDSLSGAGSAYIFERSGSTWTEVQKIVASDRGEYDSFGRSVSISGEYVIVGANRESHDAIGANHLLFAGSAYIFERSGGTWSEVQKIVASDRAAIGNFGWSVSISGDYAIVGAYQEDDDAAGGNTLSDAGSAYLFERSGGTWTEVEKIVASDRATDDNFGWSVSISGNYAIVGAYHEDEDEDNNNAFSDAGSAYIFERSGGGWSEVRKIVASDRAANDLFGNSVSISGDYAIVGAFQGNSYEGKAYLLESFPIFPHGGYALDFDGSNDYVNCGTDASVDITGTALTLEAWINADSWTTNYYEGCILCNEYRDSGRRGYMLRVGGSGQVDFAYGAGGSWQGLTSATGVMSLNTWHHLAAVLDGTTARIYVDGVEITNGGVSGSISSSSAALLIGADPGYLGSRHFDGKIDEARVWSDVRTKAEIQANMNKELTGSEANLAAYYAMANSIGTSLEDNSANSNTGTLTNGPVWKTSGALAGPRQALDFDGTDDYVSIPDHADYNFASNDFSLEFWTQWDGSPGNSSIMGQSNGSGSLDKWMVVWNTISANKLTFHTNSPGGANSIEWDWIPDADTWYHVSIVRSGTNWYLYIDGTQTGGVQSSSITVPNSTSNLWLGSDGEGAEYFNGQIDEVRIWNDARTNAEIHANMYHTLNGNEDSLKAYYRFDQQVDAGNTTLYDMTANGNHGTLSNMTPASNWVASAPFNTWIGSEDSIWTNVANWSLGSTPSNEGVGIFAWNGNNIPGLPTTINGNLYIGSDVNISRSSYFLLRGNFYNAGTFTSTHSTEFSGSSTLGGTGTTTFLGVVSVDGGLTLETDVTMNRLIRRGGYINIGSNTLTINGVSGAGAGSLVGDSTSHLIFGGSGASTELNNVTTLNSLTINRAEGITLNADITVKGVLNLANGTLSIGANTLTLDGAISQTSGSLTGGSTSNIIFGGSGASISLPAVTLDSLTINRSNGISLGGNSTIEGGLTLTNGALSIGENTLTINGAVSVGSGSLAGGISSNIIIGGSGASTTLPAVALNNLSLNRSNGMSLGGAVSVAGSLTLTDGILALGGQNLSLGESASVAGSPSAGNHINATSGNLIKGYGATGSFLFPIGDASLYSPITLNFTAGAFSSGLATVNLTTSKHASNSSTTDFINRYWTVTSSGITGFTCNVTAIYDDSDIEGGATETNIYGGKWSGSEWDNLGPVTAGSNQITGTVSSFSDFTGGESSVFPVEWLSFTAQPDGKDIQLEWATASELNSDYFSIERSQDQNTWSALGEVRAAGFSTEQQSYQFLDQQAVRGKAYYRLRQVDFDGKFSYSKVVEVVLSSSGISLYPNPVTEILTIEVEGDRNMTVKLIDIQGRVVLKTKIQGGMNTLNLSQLPAGIYSIQLRDKKGWRSEYQIVKE